MSKSLGNVLDPFKVMDVFGTDALRYYCLREVSFGQDGSVSTEGFEARYNTELANEYGNLANRTLAMIAPLPRRRRARRATAPAALAADFDGLAGRGARALRPRGADRGARGDLVARRAAAEPLRRGAGAVDARQGGQRRAARRRCSTGWPRACGWSASCCTPTCPTRRPACWRRSARTTSRSSARRSAPCPGGATVGKLPPLFPKVEPAPGRVAP